MGTKQRGLGTADSAATNADERESRGRAESTPARATTSDTLGCGSGEPAWIPGRRGGRYRGDLIPESVESLVPGPCFRRSRSACSSTPSGTSCRRTSKYTLQQVAAIGYREVEFAGLFDKEREDGREVAREDKLTSPSSHIPLDRLKDNLQGVVDECQTLGNGFVVCPWIDESMRKSADDWHRSRRLQQDRRPAAARWAFASRTTITTSSSRRSPSGEIGYDILLKECDPKLVKMEMDLYWITKGGPGPAGVLREVAGPIPPRAREGHGGQRRDRERRKGPHRLERIFAKRREAGIEHFFVENDNPKSPIEDIKVSYDYLSKLGL